MRNWLLQALPVKATRKFVVYPGDETFLAGKGVQVIGLKSLLEMLSVF